MRITGAQSYTGGTFLEGGRTVVSDPAALGTGTVSLPFFTDAELVINADGFDSGQIDVAGSFGLGGALTLRAATLNSDLWFSGGAIRAETSATATGALTDDSNMVFAAGDTLTFTQGIEFTMSRYWEVERGTVVFQGDLSSDEYALDPYDLTKTGPGTLRLEGDNSDIALTAGDGFAGGLTVIGAGGVVPDSVTIASGAAYGVEADHAYAEVDVGFSQGALAIGADTTATIDLSGTFSTLSLGSAGDHTFSGTLVPDYDTDYLGGGGGTLTLPAGVIADTDYTGDTLPDPTSIQIGRQFADAGDISHAGMVLLQGDAATPSVTGNIRIYGAAGIVDPDGDPDDGDDAFAAIADAGLITIEETNPSMGLVGMLDLGNAKVAHWDTTPYTGDLVPDSVLVDGDPFSNGELIVNGAVSRNGGTLTSADIVALFWNRPYDPLSATPPNSIRIGGGGEASDANETLVEYGAVITDPNFGIFEKYGSNQVRLQADTGGPDDNYFLDVYVYGGRLVVADDSAFGDPAALAGGAESVLVTVLGNGVFALEAGNTGTADAWVEFDLADTATLELPAADAYYARSLGVGATHGSLEHGEGGRRLDHQAGCASERCGGQEPRSRRHEPSSPGGACIP